MNRNFDRCLAAVLSEEGGFVNNPKDPGGATNKGITLRTFRTFIKPKGTVEDLKALTTDQAGIVYRRQYWDAVLGAKLPDGVDLAVFDFAVNSGVDRAIRLLQGLVGAIVDGKIGPKTLDAVSKADRAQLINDLCDERLSFLKRIKNPKTGKLLWPDFGKGWSSRVGRIRRMALGLSIQPPEGTPVVVKEQVEVPKEVPVAVVPKGAQHRGSLWSFGSLGIFSGAGTLFSSFADVPWQVKVGLGVLVLFAVAALLLRGETIVRRAKSILAEIEA